MTATPTTAPAPPPAEQLGGGMTTGVWYPVAIRWDRLAAAAAADTEHRLMLSAQDRSWLSVAYARAHRAPGGGLWVNLFNGSRAIRTLSWEQAKVALRTERDRDGRPTPAPRQDELTQRYTWEVWA